MVVKSIRTIVGESEMSWELVYHDSFKNHKILKLKSGAGYALGICIVLDADSLALSEVVRLNLRDGTWNAKEDWNQTAKMLNQRYQEMIAEVH